MRLRDLLRHIFLCFTSDNIRCTWVALATIVLYSADAERHPLLGDLLVLAAAKIREYYHIVAR